MYRTKSRQLEYDSGAYGNTYASNVGSGYCNTYCGANQYCTPASVAARYFNTPRTYSRNVLASIGNIETLRSETKPKGSWNNCDHRKPGERLNHSFGGVFSRNSAGTTCNLVYHYKNAPILSSVQDVDKHPDLDYDGASRMAWQTMQPEFVGYVEMLNFIYELKDFKDILKYAARTNLMTLRNRLYRLRTSICQKPGWYTKTAAELRLTDQFMIRPLIADIIKIHQNLMLLVDEAQDQFALKGMADNTRHYTQRFDIESSSSYNYRVYSFVGKTYDTKFTATMTYKYKYQARGYLDAFKRLWGLELTPSVVWNMIPFSFLWDYFMTIGNTLSVLEKDKNVSLTFSQYGESIKTQRIEGQYIDPFNWPNPSPIIVNGKFIEDKTPINGAVATLYTRKLAEPNKGTVLPHLKMPSKGQFINGIALARCIL